MQQGIECHFLSFGMIRPGIELGFPRPLEWTGNRT